LLLSYSNIQSSVNILTLLLAQGFGTLIAMYKRVLVKISGEQLSGKHSSGIDTDIARYFALESKKIIDAGCQLIVVVGGGNMIRGANVAGTVFAV
jgi:uridylate kinase